MPELITWPTVRTAIMELRSRSLKIDTATKQVVASQVELVLSRRQRGSRAGRHKRRGRPKFSACLQLSIVQPVMTSRPEFPSSAAIGRHVNISTTLILILGLVL